MGIPQLPQGGVEGEGGLLSVRCIFLFRLQVTSDFVSNPEKSELSRLPSLLCPVSVIANYTTWGGNWAGGTSRRESVSSQFQGPKSRGRGALLSQKLLEEAPAGHSPTVCRLLALLAYGRLPAPLPLSSHSLLPVCLSTVSALCCVCVQSSLFLSGHQSSWMKGPH